MGIGAVKKGWRYESSEMKGLKRGKRWMVGRGWQMVGSGMAC